MSKVSEMVKSLTSEAANEDTPAGVVTPDPDDHRAVEMSDDREPMVGFEPEADSTKT